MNQYSLSAWCTRDGKQTSRRVTSDAILAEYDRLRLPVPVWFTEVLVNGVRYSFEDFDTLSAAMRELAKVDPDVWYHIAEEN